MYTPEQQQKQVKESDEVILDETHSIKKESSLDTETCVEEILRDVGLDNIKKEVLQMLKTDGPRNAMHYMNDNASMWKRATVKIAVAGKSSVGKSAFINAIRNVKSTDEGSAEEGLGDTTLVVQEYKHPKNKEIIYCDLPGYGTVTMTREMFIEKVNLIEYDLFFIFVDPVPTEDDQWLFEQLRKADKKFCFVKAKLDQDMKNLKRMGMTEENDLAKIKKPIVDATKTMQSVKEDTAEKVVMAFFNRYEDEYKPRPSEKENLEDDAGISLQLDYLVISAFNIKHKAERKTETTRSFLTHSLYDLEHLDELKDISVQLREVIISAAHLRKQIPIYTDNRASLEIRILDKLMKSSKDLIYKTEAIHRKIRCSPHLTTDQIVLNALGFIERSITELKDFKHAITEELSRFPMRWFGETQYRNLSISQYILQRNQRNRNRFKWFFGQYSIPCQHNDMWRSAAEIIVDALRQELRCEGLISTGSIQLKLSHAKWHSDTMTNMLINRTAAISVIVDFMIETKRRLVELKEEISGTEATDRKGYTPNGQTVRGKRNIDTDKHEFNIPTKKRCTEAIDQKEYDPYDQIVRFATYSRNPDPEVSLIKKLTNKRYFIISMVECTISPPREPSTVRGGTTA